MAEGTVNLTKLPWARENLWLSSNLYLFGGGIHVIASNLSNMSRHVSTPAVSWMSAAAKSELSKVEGWNTVRVGIMCPMNTSLLDSLSSSFRQLEKMSISSQTRSLLSIPCKLTKKNSRNFQPSGPGRIRDLKSHLWLTGWKGYLSCMASIIQLGGLCWITIMHYHFLFPYFSYTLFYNLVDLIE